LYKKGEILMKEQNENDKQNYNLKELIEKTRKELEISQKTEEILFEKKYTMFAIMFGGNNPEQFLKNWKTKSKNEKIFIISLKIFFITAIILFIVFVWEK
jgi:hypothetical protein